MSNFGPRELMQILVEKCPSYGQPLPSCPLSRFREEPNVQKRREKLAAMGDDEVAELYELHLECVCKVCGS